MSKDLDTVLRTRAEPKIPAYLSTRILAGVERRKSSPLNVSRVWASEIAAVIQSVFTIPKPAMAFGVFILFALGMYLGSATDPVSFLPGITPGELASFMVIEDRFVVGEWV